MNLASITDSAPIVTKNAHGVALDYSDPDSHDGAVRLKLSAGRDHCVRLAGQAQKSHLLAAALDFQLKKGATLTLLGEEVNAVPGKQRNEERAALRRRIGFLPSTGGLLSSLNGWENIVLPLEFHHPEQAGGIAARVHDLAKQLDGEMQSGDMRELLAKIPESMTAYEKKFTGCLRTLLEAPELLLVDELMHGLDHRERERAAGFSAAYRAVCPGGTWLLLEEAHNDREMTQASSSLQGE